MFLNQPLSERCMAYMYVSQKGRIAIRMRVVILGGVLATAIAQGLAAEIPNNAPPTASPMSDSMRQALEKANSAAEECMKTVQARFGVLENRLFAPNLSPITLGFTIKVDGTVKDVTVEQSSGDEALDRLALNCATLLHYEFQNDHPVETPWHFHINWRDD